MRLNTRGLLGTGQKCQLSITAVGPGQSSWFAGPNAMAPKCCLDSKCCSRFEMLFSIRNAVSIRNDIPKEMPSRTSAADLLRQVR
jgi:hypothetical protein